MSQQTTNSPLWRVLNEARTQGEWISDDTQVTRGMGPNDETIFDGESNTEPYPSVWERSRKEAKANAAYTALAVNNLHKLAEALTRIRESSLQGLEMYANGEKFSFETLAGFVAEISGEALAAIS